ncbi:MAG: prepilin-type N-terminal cleavage/methylation domain-containing protein [Planctomycetota bacterium]|jgi:prepilin-type N-terminal cleavage/methylation domain-containing protein|nr:prepilin-type N-terminal cleavage/methylation domain-containing protein [Planctomycetota bacterium]
MDITSRRSRQGFTLIELLVVMMILAILMGLLFPILGIVKESGRKTKTAALIANAGSAIERYRSLNAGYPEAVTVTNVGGTAVALTDTPTWTGSDPFNRAWFSAAIASIDSDAFGPASANMSEMQVSGQDVRLLVDSWATPINYRPYTKYEWTAGSTIPIRSDEPPNPDSFQIWSCGPNAQDDDGLKDDINNWGG